MPGFERGMHLIIDGYDCHSELLGERAALLHFLRELPEKIGMSVLIPAMVKEIEYPLCKVEDQGLSGFVAIYESHIAVHTWPKQAQIQADVYSCKPFDPEAVLAHFVHDFGMGSFDTELIERRKRHFRL